MPEVIETRQWVGYRIDTYDDGSTRIVWDQGSETWRRDRVLTRLRNAIRTLDDAAAGWADLTTAQRTAAIGLAVRTVADVARVALNKFADEPLAGDEPVGET